MPKSGPSQAVRIAAFVWVLALLIAAVAALDATLAKLSPAGVNEADPKLGWRLKRNAAYHREKETFGHRRYDVAFSTDEFGTRTFGTRRDAPVKILVLGDSYSGEPYASNDQMWYAAFVRRLAALTNRPVTDFFVVAAASGGYGTLQSLLLAQEVKTFYAPTLLVHQFCDNDFDNNSFDVEQKSVVLNQRMLRPYLAADRETIIWRESALARLYRTWLYRSALFGALDRALQVALSTYYGGFLMISASDPDDWFRQVRALTYDPQAVELTRFLLTRLRNSFENIPALLVNCPIESSSTNEIWVDVARSAGFVPITEPSDTLVAAKLRGESDLFAADGAHLSDAGNEAMGRALAERVARLGLTASR